jgi:hypothetical protein
MIDVGRLDQGSLCLYNDRTYIVLGKCRAHPNSMQLVELVGGEVHCFLNDRQVKPLTHVRIDYGEE